MYSLIDQLLSDETSRTIIQTIVNFFHSKTITDEITLILTRQFYQVLAETLDMEYGSMLLATLTTAQMRAMIWNKWPFFTNLTDLVKKCLQESDCNAVQGINQNLGKKN